MNQQTFNTAAATPPPLSYESGFSLPAAEIKKLAKKSAQNSDKKLLMEGVIAAAEDGRVENLVAFIGGYLELQRESGQLEKLDNSDIGESLRELLTQPLIFFLEKQPDPLMVIGKVTQGFALYYRQTLLDVTLRTACARNAWSLIADLHAAGADVNAGNGMALLAALQNNHQRSIAAMTHCGADFELVKKLPNINVNFDAYKTRIDTAKARFGAVEPPTRLLAKRPQASTSFRLPAPAPVPEKPDPPAE